MAHHMSASPASATQRSPDAGALRASVSRLSAVDATGRAVPAAPTRLGLTVEVAAHRRQQLPVRRRRRELGSHEHAESVEIRDAGRRATLKPLGKPPHRHHPDVADQPWFPEVLSAASARQGDDHRDADLDPARHLRGHAERAVELMIQRDVPPLASRGRRSA